MVCVPLTEGDIIHFPSELLGRLLVQRVRGHDRSFPCVSKIVVLGSLRLLGEVWPVEDGLDLAIRSYLTLVASQLGASVADVISEISFSYEFLNLILEHNALLCGVADILVVR